MTEVSLFRLYALRAGRPLEANGGNTVSIGI
jgi:hypothetical protein